MRARDVIITACVVGALAAYLFSNEFHALSTDAGQHYALVRMLMDMDGWVRPAQSYLGPMTSYPPLAHWIAAGVGTVAGSGLLGMAFVATASVALFYLVLFILALRIDPRVPIVACALIAAYALLRGPVFGRQIVNNYFFAQTVGSAIAIATLLLMLDVRRRWKPAACDLFVLAAGQLLVATHLTPASQLIAAYCTILACEAWIKTSRATAVRLALFATGSLVLTALNPYARILVLAAQQGGGAHINHLLGAQPVQLAAAILGSLASLRLLSKTSGDDDAGLFLGCTGLALCGLMMLQLMLRWIGFGSDYAVAKHVFVTVTVLIVIIAANLTLARRPPRRAGDAQRTARGAAPNAAPGPGFGLAWCAVLALLASRADLYPSVVELRQIVSFQDAVRETAQTISTESAGRLKPIALVSAWPAPIGYMINLGDLKQPFEATVPPAQDQRAAADVILMPPDDRRFVPACRIPAYTTAKVAVLDYPCLLQAAPRHR